MTAGYSAKPLAQKLGIKPGFRVALLNPPANYAALVAPLPDAVTFHKAHEGALNCIHLFAHTFAELEQQLPLVKSQIVTNGMIWVSWPKRAAKIATDLTEDLIRQLALSEGLVDVKVCAVDTTWSGLKLVIPIANRT
ncbi:DUF3052 domain-containing protein [Kouleothrix sp.]|uniref:DUF3052 domain-containing protein n=1 Tax=Kouleothrix sp. TaxID=2779161 RepID=UPI003919B32F